MGKGIAKSNKERRSLLDVAQLSLSGLDGRRNVLLQRRLGAQSSREERVPLNDGRGAERLNPRGGVSRGVTFMTAYTLAFMYILVTADTDSHLVIASTRF